MIFGKSWKTTSAGILAIIGGIAGIWFTVKSATGLTMEALTGYITAILTGVGLIFAKDSNVTGGTTQQ